MSLPVTFTKTLAADDADGIALAQNPGANADVLLNGAFVTGGVANLTTQRRVLITPGGADNAVVFTIYGTNQGGAQIVEVVQGVDSPSTASSTLDFLTVTRIATSGNAANGLTVGTSAVGSTPWYVLNKAIQPVNVGIGGVITGTVSGDIEYTYDDPNSGVGGLRQTNAATVIPAVYDHSVLVAQTANFSGSVTAPVMAVRWTTNSGTGTAAVTFLQAGIAGP